MDKRLICEVDIDGTIADIFTPIESLIKREGYEDFSFNKVVRYDGRVEGVGCPRAVMNKWYEVADVYSMVEPYSGAIEFIDWLLRMKVLVIANTKCYNTSVRDAKSIWISEINKKLQYGEIEYIADCSLGDKILLNNADIILEDALDNVRRSNAPTKFIIGRHHNKPEYNSQYKQVFEDAYYIDNEFDTVNYVKIKETIQTVYPEVCKHAV